MRPSTVRPVARSPRSARRRAPSGGLARIGAAALVAVTMAGLGAAPPPVAAAGPTAAAGRAAADGPTAADGTAARAVPSVRRVTLITGDVVRVITGRGGTQTIALEPGPDGQIPQVAISRVGVHVYVVPRAAMPLLAAGRLDHDLFDVHALIADRRDDARSSAIPLIVDYGRGAAAAARADASRIPHASKVRTLEALGAAAFAARKCRRAGRLAEPHRPARRRWRTDGARVGRAAHRPRRPGPRARRRRGWNRSARPRPGRPASTAPGTTVAVLDSGYDPTHPDLAGPGRPDRELQHQTSRSSTATATGRTSRPTLAGTGAGSGGVHGGVAQGARAADRQGARRLGLRRGLGGAGRHGVGRGSRRRRREPEPRRRRRATATTR